MPSSTTNYAFNLPLVNDPIDADLWGGQLNANWTSLDALLYAAGLRSGGGLETADNLFRVVGSSDATKKLAFEVDGLTTATTRTLTVQDKNGTLPVIETANVLIPGTSAGPASISLAEDTDNGTNTATIIAPANIASNLTHTLPNRSGTLAVGARTQVVLTSGTSWSVPAGVEQVFARLVGGGGGGGGAGAANTLAGGGGGAGGYCEGFLTVTPSGTVAYTIGGAGSGGSAGANNGSAGGNTTFSTLTANGGGGGAGAASFNVLATAGTGGTASGGTVNISGQDGLGGFGTSGGGFISGAGGTPAGGLGVGAAGRNASFFSQGSGNAGTGYGSGGSGGYSTGTAQAGGNGTQGVIILEY